MSSPEAVTRTDGNTVDKPLNLNSYTKSKFSLLNEDNQLRIRLFHNTKLSYHNIIDKKKVITFSLGSLIGSRRHSK